MEDIKLDLKDWKILGILCTDARTPNTKIAKRVGLSVEAVGYRIRKLEESGVIRKYGIYPDELKINIKTFFVFLKFTTMSEHDENRFIEIFTKHQNVGVVWESSGNWDFILIIYAADIFIFAKIIDDLLSRVARHLKEYKSLFALEQIKFTQLIGEELKAFKDPYATITPLEKRLDTLIITDKEKKLLSYLDDHGRASAVAISKTLNIPPETVRFAMNRLREKQVFITTYAALDYFKLGYSKYVLVIKHLLHDNKRLQMLLKALADDIHVRHVSRMGGANEVIVTIFVKTNEELNRYLRNYQNLFPEIILGIEINQVFKRLKEKLLI
ncbi:MAG: Lrp/AsnC family transcriptional regulator [Nanoarchaeota archaeon]